MILLIACGDTRTDPGGHQVATLGADPAIAGGGRKRRPASRKSCRTPAGSTAVLAHPTSSGVGNGHHAWDVGNLVSKLGSFKSNSTGGDLTATSGTQPSDNRAALGHLAGRSDAERGNDYAALAEDSPSASNTHSRLVRDTAARCRKNIQYYARNSLI